MMLYRSPVTGKAIELPGHLDETDIIKRGFIPWNDAIPVYVRESNNIPNDAIRFNSYKTGVVNKNADGYGRATLNLFDVMKRVGIHEDNDSDCNTVILIHSGLGIAQETSNPKWRKKKKIGISMWETTRLPKGWVTAYNKLDLLVVPSNFCAHYYKKCGVTIPIEVLPFPIDTETLDVRKRDSTKEPFIFLHYSWVTRRKGWHLALEAFEKEFDEDENVRFIIKSRGPIIGLQGVPPNVEVITQTWEEGKLANLMFESDCFVNASLGEGYGMVDMEFMASGGTTISTYAHALKDHLNEDVAYLLTNNKRIKVTYKDMQSWEGLFKEEQDLGYWYKPSVKEIREKMRYAFENRKETADKGILASEYIRKNFSFDALQERIRTFFYEHIER